MNIPLPLPVVFNYISESIGLAGIHLQCLVTVVIQRPLLFNLPDLQVWFHCCRGIGINTGRFTREPVIFPGTIEQEVQFGIGKPPEGIGAVCIFLFNSAQPSIDNICFFQFCCDECPVFF